MYRIVEEGPLNDRVDEVGAAIQQLRLARGLSREKLAILAGVSTASVRRLESGDRGARLHTVIALAIALDVELQLVSATVAAAEDDFAETAG